MPKITVNNKDYEFDALSEQAQAQVRNMQFVDAELARLNAQIAVCQTARMAYGKSLEAELPTGFEGDTLKLD